MDVPSLSFRLPKDSSESEVFGSFPSAWVLRDPSFGSLLLCSSVKTFPAVALRGVGFSPCHRWCIELVSRLGFGNSLDMFGV